MGKLYAEVRRVLIKGCMGRVREGVERVCRGEGVLSVLTMF